MPTDQMPLLGHSVEACQPQPQEALASAIDAALNQRHLPLARRLAQSAIRLTPRIAGLCQSIGRLRLMENDPEGALRALESADTPSDSLLLLRAVSLLRLGRQPEAHLQLIQLDSQPASAPAARVLLSLMEWEEGDRERAPGLLGTLDQTTSTLHARILRLLLAVDSGNTETMSTAANDLRQLALFPHLRETVELVIASLGLPIRLGTKSPTPHLSTVARLTIELRAASGLLPSLLAAQRVAFDSVSARLLLESLTHGLGSWPDEETACGAIVELSYQLDGPVVASIWLDRGLARLPGSSLLCHLEESLSAGDPPIVDARAARRRDVLATIGPPTSQQSGARAA